jgi:hypothetical protein
MRFALLALPAALLFTAPAGAETRSFNLSGFDSVSAIALMDVVLKQGPYSVKVEEPHGKFDDLKIEVHGSTLVATRQDNNGRRKDEAPAYTVVVTAPSIKRISVAAASTLDGRKLAFKDLDIELSSASTITLSGSCGALKLNISSGAKFEGDDLKCQTARVDVSSGATARAFASQNAQADASTGAR